MVLEATESGIKEWKERLKPDQVLFREDTCPSFFTEMDEELVANRERLKHLNVML